MANGGGPACLRLRVVADPASVDPRFIVDDAKLGMIADVIGRHWPEQIHIDDLQRPALIADIERARSALLDSLGLGELA
jgi:succinylarginine dihydrolase